MPGVPAWTADGRIAWTADSAEPRRLAGRLERDAAGTAEPVTPPGLQVRAGARRRRRRRCCSPRTGDRPGGTRPVAWRRPARLTDSAGSRTGGAAAGRHHAGRVSRGLDAPRHRRDRPAQRPRTRRRSRSRRWPRRRPARRRARGSLRRAAADSRPPSCCRPGTTPGSARLPVLCDPYGGPHAPAGGRRAQRVPGRRSGSPTRASPCVIADGRGTPGRGPGLGPGGRTTTWPPRRWRTRSRRCSAAAAAVPRPGPDPGRHPRLVVRRLPGRAGRAAAARTCSTPRWPARR